MGEAEELSLEDGVLHYGARSVPVGDVLAFRERFDGWWGRGVLDVIGTPLHLPIGEGYGAQRAALRSWFDDRPFDVDWADGRFPMMPLGLPPVTALVALTMVLAVGGAAATWLLGPEVGAVFVASGCYPLVRLRDGVVARRSGLRLGPPWAPVVPWYEVEGVSFEIRARRCLVWADAPGLGSATLPTVLLPALRGRLRRLGGIELTERPVDLDARYQVWRGPAVGVPWGVLAAVLVSVWFTPAPWFALGIGLVVVLGQALLSAAIEARASGWGTGAILWLTGAYGVVLASISLGYWLS